MKDKIHNALERYFGYDSFREYQEEIVESILKGRDTVAIMPTGAGKSLCYQLPGIMVEGVTVVISPLISLMKDQVDYLDNIGIPAVYLNSSLSSVQFRERLRGIYENRYKMIYVAPERLETEGFIHAMNSLGALCAQVIVDEAHCVSQWGHDFRPSYTKIAGFIRSLHIRPVVAAFTATATDAVREDIESCLELQNPMRFITGFDRKNLEFKVMVNEDKDRYIKTFVKENVQDTGIIYAATRKEAERLYKVLKDSSISCAVYHAGLSDEERNRAQEDFIYDNVSVMIATNAFGMGIDKSNVRYVIHYNMPGDMEAYYQEAGRAGRDGLPSVCVLLYSPGDTAVQKFFIDEGQLSEDRKAFEYKKLQVMENYCHTSTCLRKYMLEYFGDHSGEENCGNCSVCRNESEEKDITLEAQMILSCINRSGQRFGKSIIIDTLRGSKNKKVLGFGLSSLKTYGLLADRPKDELEFLVNRLIVDGFLHKTEEQYPVLKLTPKSVPLLKNKEKLVIQVAKKPEKKKTEDGLLTKLKQLRKEIAVREGYPPYVIFHDKTLIEMSELRPATIEEFAYIKGVGESRKNKYGEEFLSVILQYTEGCGLKKEVPVKSNFGSRKEEGKTPEPVRVLADDMDVPKEQKKVPVYKKYAMLYQNGMSMEEISVIMDVTVQSAAKNLFRAYREGELKDIKSLIQPEYEEAVIRAMLRDEWDGRLRTLKESLPEEVSYVSIQGVIEKLRKKLSMVTE